MKLAPRKRNLIVVALLAACVVMVLPWLWAIAGAFSPQSQALNGGLVPTHPTLSNISSVWSGQAGPVARWMGNSVAVSLAAATIVVVVDSLAAYGLARLRFGGRRLIIAAVLTSLVVPFIALLVPLYQEFDQFNLLDTYWALILPYGGNAFGVFLLFQFFRQLPVELEEAALMDGAGRLAVWWKVAMPLAFPAVATLWILTFVRVYNDFFWPLISTSTESMRTITVGISIVAVGEFSTNDALLMGLTVVSIVPMLVAFIFAQKRLVEGLSAGGLVG